jgi:DNA repair protein RadA/Sms
MTKPTPSSPFSSDREHVCVECGHGAHRWFGRCPECGAWSSARASTGGEEVIELTTVTGAESPTERFASNVGEVDRVLGGGIVPGSVTLVAGEPGVGKSTLLLQLVAGLEDRGHRCLVVTGEESVAQVSMRAARLGIASGRLTVGCSTSLGAVLATARREHPDVLVIDSVQTLEQEGLEQPAGSVVQVRESASALVRHAKSSGTAVLLVGHVTKDGAVAGPKTLEHVVDVVLTLGGERSGALRLVRVTKNRYGSCEETGVLTMSERGLEPVADPSLLLLADRRPGVSGSVVFPAVEGTRPVLVEVQALVSRTRSVPARRVAIGIDGRRLALLLGVMAQHAAVALGNHDVFVSGAGGLAVREPAVDLALCLALFSAHNNIALPEDCIAFGEVGLGGEVRRAPATERRLTEAVRLGFRRAILPRRASAPRSDIDQLEVEDLAGAMRAFESARRVA